MGRSKINLLLIIPVVCLILIWVNSSAAQQCKPLLIADKKTLFQRVISHPGANLYVAAKESSPLVQTRVKPFTVFYVYEKTSVDDTAWLKVGPSSNCQLSGWINGAFVSEWRQSLTLVFTERSARKPVLFFNSLNALERVAGSAAPGQGADQLTARFTDIKSGNLPEPEDFQIVAMEPQEEAVSRQRFYMMPIFILGGLFMLGKYRRLGQLFAFSGFGSNMLAP